MGCDIKVGPEKLIPNRQGIEFEIELKVSMNVEDIVRELKLNKYGHGFYRNRTYGPGKVKVERVSDAWGHGNNKMIWFTPIN